MEHSAAAVAAATTPKKTHFNLDTISNKSSSSYTSLRDMLPFPAAALNSPTSSASAAAASSSGGGSISIRNRLVKQAAWAYLQPMSPSPSGPSGPNFIGRLRLRFESESRRHRLPNGDIRCLSFLSDMVACFNRVFQQILHAITGQVTNLFPFSFSP
ncbi:hypothetical protein PIB30_036531 [Stylosanthes scabra]|uniref:Uncharacterized protein n=1 Tax=Stylosanthes scabra TaxID=79078 RepID=A0ABU6SDP4_9FABA|nr:hypothetical protein [Stylosanthes scabra]